MKEVYTVVDGEDNYGISSFHLFDSEDKAREFVKSTLLPRYCSEAFPWIEEPVDGALANWRAGCDYITIFKTRVN